MRVKKDSIERLANHVYSAIAHLEYEDRKLVLEELENISKGQELPKVEG